MMQQPDVLSHTIGFVLKVNVFFALAHLYILRGKISYALPLLLDLGIKSQFTQVQMTPALQTYGPCIY